MKKLILVLFVVSQYVHAQDINLNYYLPDSVTYDPSVPKPKDVIYHGGVGLLNRYGGSLIKGNYKFKW